MRVIFENPRMLLFTPYHVVTSCKISEKYNGCPLRKADADARTDARNRVNSKVPIPTKVGGPIRGSTTGRQLMLRNAII